MFRICLSVLSATGTRTPNRSLRHNKPATCGLFFGFFPSATCRAPPPASLAKRTAHREPCAVRHLLLVSVISHTIRAPRTAAAAARTAPRRRRRRSSIRAPWSRVPRAIEAKNGQNAADLRARSARRARRCATPVRAGFTRTIRL